MERKAEIYLTYQNYIEAPPIAPATLYGQAAANDTVTINSWRETWIKNIRANKAKFGSFKEHSIGKLFGSMRNQPVIVAGSGPSLKYNGEQLKDRSGLGLVSCLHNFHYFEDRDIKVDYYVSLDSGPVVLEEISEGGSKTAEEYWALTKDRTLLAYIGSDPKLFEKWQGKVYLFNCPVPDAQIIEEVEKIEKFNLMISNGGNVLGACMYIAKGIFGASTIAFVGADFSFSSYDGPPKFHAWDSKYDKSLGNVIKMTDVYGNKALTWQSYANFKCWFDYIAMQVLGLWVNCTEGGTFGAYSEGNIMAVKQMRLKEFIRMHTLCDELKEQCEKPDEVSVKLLF